MENTFENVIHKMSAILPLPQLAQCNSLPLLFDAEWFQYMNMWFIHINMRMMRTFTGATISSRIVSPYSSWSRSSFSMLFHRQNTFQTITSQTNFGQNISKFVVFTAFYHAELV